MPDRKWERWKDLALSQAKLDILKKRLRFAGPEVSMAHPFISSGRRSS
jgi:hypothetical protein